ncbi:MAG TPA: polysaccharide deacetylase family protein [Methylomirabilota bacterium]|nr:polysaccharide deacetylase family protein [Methylomirabilota bacterium]
MQPQRSGPFPYVPINRRPRITWPNGARLALWVIPNVETFPLNEPVPGGTGLAPDVINWAPRDYGNRVGIFRLMEVMVRHGVPGTVALNAEVCDDYPQIIEDGRALGWEFMGHNQSNARLLHLMAPDEERRVVLATFSRIEKATGYRPKGWLSSGLQESWHTLDYLVEAGATYVADWINDDQPYLMNIGGQRLCSIPYSGEINDLPQILRAGRSSDEFELMIRRQFDTLYREGAQSGRVMAICLHPFIIGVPHRIGALDAALAYILRHEGVWRATGSEIIDHYLASEATF